MGVDISGGMIVGAMGADLIEHLGEDVELWELAEEHELGSYAQWYDAPEKYVIYGYEVDDIGVDELNEEWIAGIKEKGRKFKELTGVDATLFGAQNVW